MKIVSTRKIKNLIILYFLCVFIFGISKEEVQYLIYKFRSEM